MARLPATERPWADFFTDPALRDPITRAQTPDQVPIQSVKVAEDGKSVFLEVAGLIPVMQMRIKMNVKAVDGSRVPDDIAHTINVVPEKEGEDYRSFAK